MGQEVFVGVAAAVLTSSKNPNGVWTLTMVDQKKGLPLEPCVDTVEWQYVDETRGSTWVCDDFQNADCTDPAQVPADIAAYKYLNFTVGEACCACGGGVDVTTLQSTLVSWRLVAYGREGGATVLPTDPDVEVNGDENFDIPEVIPGDSPSPATTNGTSGPSEESTGTTRMHGNRVLTRFVCLLMSLCPLSFLYLLS